MSNRYAKDLLKHGWDASDLASALSTIQAAWVELDSLPRDDEPVVAVYLKDLVDMYHDYAEDDDFPVWDKLTEAEQEAAIAAVVSLHENVDEYHAMVDAIEEL